MTPYETAEFDKFISPLLRWKKAYTKLVYSYLGVKTSAGHNLLYGRLLMATAGRDAIEAPFKFDTDHIFASRFTKTISGDAVFEAIEKIVTTSEIETLDKVIGVAREANSKSISLHLDPIQLPFSSKFVLRGASHHSIQSVPDYPRQIERELQAADTPYESLDELLNHCGLPLQRGMGDASMLDIVASSPGLIDRGSTFDEQKWNVECRVSGELQTDKIRLGWRRIHKDQRIARGSLFGDSIRWRKEGNELIGTCTIAAENAPLLQLYLSYDGIMIDTFPLVDPAQKINLWHAAHQTFDPQFEFLKESLLSPESGKNNTFEFAVSTFFSLCGFLVANHGRFPKLQDGPDILIMTPAGSMAVVECTVGLIDNKGKISKLVQRKQQLDDQLSVTGRKVIQTQAMIFTLLRREQIQGDIPSAAKHGVAVICKQDLEDFMNQFAVPPDPEIMFEELKQLIPKAERFLSLGF